MSDAYERGPVIRVIPVVRQRDLPPSDFWDALEMVLEDYVAAMRDRAGLYSPDPEDDPNVRALRAALAERAVP